MGYIMRTRVVKSYKQSRKNRKRQSRFDMIFQQMKVGPERRRDAAFRNGAPRHGPGSGPVAPCPAPAKRSNSTRGLTRSAFETLRANLAGSLELSRMYPRAAASTTTTTPTATSSRRPAPATPQATPPATPPVPAPIPPPSGNAIPKSVSYHYCN